MPVRSYAVGRAHAGEADLVLTANDYAGGGPLVIVAHGAGGSPDDYLIPANRRDLDLLAEAGCVVVIAALGGLSTWATDTVVHPTTGRITEVRTYAASTWDTDDDRVVLIGDSMGGQNVLIYPTLLPEGERESIRAVVARIPVVRADALHDRNAGLGFLIDSAWGSGANWDAAVPTRDPISPAPAAAIASMRDRVLIYYSDEDTTIIPADVDAYVAATGVEARLLEGNVPHAHGYIPPHDQASWVCSRLAGLEAVVA